MCTCVNTDVDMNVNPAPRTLFSASVFLWVKLCTSAGGAISALARQRLPQPPAPVPLDSARLQMASLGQVRSAPVGSLSGGDALVFDADGGYGVKGKHNEDGAYHTAAPRAPTPHDARQHGGISVVAYALPAARLNQPSRRPHCRRRSAKPAL